MKNILSLHLFCCLDANVLTHFRTNDYCVKIYLFIHFFVSFRFVIKIYIQNLIKRRFYENIAFLAFRLFWQRVSPLAAAAVPALKSTS